MEPSQSPPLHPHSAAAEESEEDTFIPLIDTPPPENHSVFVVYRRWWQAIGNLSILFVFILSFQNRQPSLASAIGFSVGALLAAFAGPILLTGVVWLLSLGKLRGLGFVITYSIGFGLIILAGLGTHFSK